MFGWFKKKVQSKKSFITINMDEKDFTIEFEYQKEHSQAFILVVIALLTGKLNEYILNEFPEEMRTSLKNIQETMQLTSNDKSAVSQFEVFSKIDESL